MWKTETLAELFKARDVISQQVIALAPSTDEQRSQLSSLMKQRDRITAQIQAVMVAGLRPEKFADVERQVQALEEACARLKSFSGRLEDLQQAIEAADQIVKVAAAIVA